MTKREPNPQVIVRGGHARVIDLDERAVAILQRQRQCFVEKFGREPGPSDPVFFDPGEDEPVPLTEEGLRMTMERVGTTIDQLEALAADRRAIQEEHGISRKIGRNDPCPCGSGSKFKHCHGA